MKKSVHVRRLAGSFLSILAALSVVVLAGGLAGCGTSKPAVTLAQLRHAVRPALKPVAAAAVAPARPVPSAATRPAGAALALAAGAATGEQFNGTSTDVMLQGFHWTSINSNNPGWYEIVRQNAQRIKDAGFDVVWLPPPSQSAFGNEGYMPNRWNRLDSSYGSTDELKRAIDALKPAKALADVVVNHRNGVASGGFDFAEPAFADNRAAVVSDDDCHCGTGNPDTGEGQPAGRDLDHKNASVQQEVKNYLGLLKSVGYAGWRYDEVKGYGGEFVASYNDASQPYLSVGEFWVEDRQQVVNWIDATRGKSMAFDFPTRTQLKAAVRDRNFGLLKTIDGKPTGVIGWWPAMSVTFVEDHDTAADHPFPEEFGNGDQVLQGYAYILTHPGIPCVFWSHFFDFGPTTERKIRELIRVRKDRGINSRSVVNIVAADNAKYAAIVDDKVAVKIGPGPWDPGAGWHVATDGNDYAVWVRD